MTSSATTLDGPKAHRRSATAFVRSLLKGEKVDDQATMTAIEARLPASTLNAVRDWGLTLPEIAAAVGVSPRTLLRKLSGRQSLGVSESDRLVRLARVLADADALIGNHDNAVAWLHDVSLALGNVIPLSLLSTDTGVALVRQSLGVIAYGGVA